MVRAQEPLIVGEVALVQFQGTRRFVVQRIQVGEVGSCHQSVRIIQAENPLAVGEVLLMQGVAAARSPAAR